MKLKKIILPSSIRNINIEMDYATMMLKEETLKMGNKFYLNEYGKNFLSIVFDECNIVKTSIECSF